MSSNCNVAGVETMKVLITLEKANSYHMIADNSGHRLLTIGNRKLTPRYNVSDVIGQVWKIIRGNCKLIVTIRVK